ncbi:uncharacterized protein METZ01_LOCUS267860, partial [marine metagenome]
MTLPRRTGIVPHLNHLKMLLMKNYRIILIRCRSEYDILVRAIMMNAEQKNRLKESAMSYNKR